MLTITLPFYFSQFLNLYENRDGSLRDNILKKKESKYERSGCDLIFSCQAVQGTAGRVCVSPSFNVI